VTGELERTALVEAIGREVARVSGVSEIVVVLKSGADEATVVALHSPAGRESIDGDKAQKLALMVLQAGRLVRIDAALVGSDRAGDAPSWLGVPMSGGNVDYGTLLVAGDGSFSESDERLLTDIGQLAGLGAEQRAVIRGARPGVCRARGGSGQPVAGGKAARARADGVRRRARLQTICWRAISGRTQLLLGRIDDPVQKRGLQAISCRR